MFNKTFSTKDEFEGNRKLKRRFTSMKMTLTGKPCTKRERSSMAAKLFRQLVASWEPDSI